MRTIHQIFSGRPAVTTTLFFRSAVRLGVPHLAGRAVTLYLLNDGKMWAADCDGRYLGLCNRPADLRALGGLPPGHKRKRRMSPKTRRLQKHVLSDGFDRQPEVLAQFFSEMAGSARDQ